MYISLKTLIEICHFNYIYLFFTLIFISDLNDMRKVRFMEASEQSFRNELAKVREENQRLIKKMKRTSP